MKINLKIVLPIYILLAIILVAFGYLLYYLNLQAQVVEDQSIKLRQLNMLSDRLSREQETTEYNILIYTLSQDQGALSAINDSEINKAKIVDSIYPLVSSIEEKKLIENYINARKDIGKLRGEFFKAIDSKNELEIRNKYGLWSAQTQKIRNSITALQEYNVLNLTEILNTFRKIGERLGEIILLLSAVVILSIFALFYYLRQTITLPIVKLSNYVDEISEKNFSNIVDDEVVRKDEIGALFKAFINLSRRLKNSYNQLEKKVQERTIELSNRTTELENTQKATLNILEDLNAERATLLETQALDSAILASIGDALVVIDTEGVITYVNQSFESITGWKSEEVKGKVFVDIIPSESEKGLPTPNKERFITKIISGENPENDYTSTAYYKRKDGSRFPVSSVVRRILLNDKQIGAVKTFSDITRMRDIDKAKSEFVSLAAHQLRTPLSAISWYTEMLLSGDAGDISDLQKRYLEQIYQGNQRMIAMVKSFLDVSRIEMGFLLLNKEQVQVNKLLENVIEEQQQKLKSKNIALELEYEQDIPTIRLDREKMFMVFQNLLSNAIKYTPEGGKITITATQNKPEQSLLIKISDTGFGIPEEAKEKIFSKLYRAQNVVEKATAGTGLGLYIVKNIVDNSGGKIWFESEEHKGTTFFLQLPML